MVSPATPVPVINGATTLVTLSPWVPLSLAREGQADRRRGRLVAEEQVTPPPSVASAWTTAYAPWIGAAAQRERADSGGAIQHRDRAAGQHGLGGQGLYVDLVRRDGRARPDVEAGDPAIEALQDAAAATSVSSSTPDEPRKPSVT